MNIFTWQVKIWLLLELSSKQINTKDDSKNGTFGTYPPMEPFFFFFEVRNLCQSKVFLPLKMLK